MKYMGSKKRYARDILGIIEKREAPLNSLYVEPFMGGANVFHLAPHPKWGNDINADVVAMFAAVAEGWVPPSFISEEDYKAIREGESGPLRGFVGIGSSYAGKFFKGYARGKDSKGNPRNYTLESKNALMREAGGLRGAKFTSMTYYEMDIPESSVVYCDPPYAETTSYQHKFDSKKFWNWCDNLNVKGLYVSEFYAPSNWECIWEAPSRCTSLTKDTGALRAVERLWIRKGH